jgi:hypothetical protein
MTIGSETGAPDLPSVELESVDATPILAFVLVLLILLGGLVWGATYWFKSEADLTGRRAAADASYPDLERLRIAGQQQLNRYEILASGAVRIPVEQAIVKLSEEFPADARISEEMDDNPVRE